MRRSACATLTEEVAAANELVGAGLVVTLGNYLATTGFPVTIITGIVFMVCVLLFRRGIVGEFYASRIGRKLGFEYRR